MASMGTFARLPMNSPRRGMSPSLLTYSGERFPGPLPSGDPRTQERAQPRLDKIRTNERDLADTRAYLRTLPQGNGHVAVMGFCYGGPFAILGSKRLGYDAGPRVSWLSDARLPWRARRGHAACLPRLVGDQDHRAPPPVLDAYQDVASRMTNVEVHIFPGVQHGFMMPSDAEAFDAPTRDFAMQRAFAILDGLRGEPLLRYRSLGCIRRTAVEPSPIGRRLTRGDGWSRPRGLGSRAW